MAFQFPASPVLGQIFEPTPGTSYKWNGTGWSPYSTLFPGGGTFTGPVLHADGTVSAPGISWANEPNSGWYRAGTNDIRLGLGGVVRMQHTTASTWFAGGISALSNGNLVVPGNATANTLWAGDGTLAAPGIAFASETGLGIYRAGAGTITYTGANQEFVNSNLHLYSSKNVSVYAGPFGNGGSSLNLWAETARSVIYSPSQGIDYSATGHNFYGAITTNSALTMGGAITLPHGTPLIGLTVGGSNRQLILSWQNDVFVGEAGGVTYIRGGGKQAQVAGDGFTTGGSLVAEGGVYGYNGGSIALQDDSGYAKLRFTTDNYRLELYKAGGTVTMLNSSNARMFSCGPSGNFDVQSKGYQPGGGPWGDNSDARIKENITDYTSGLAAVLALRPVSYTFRPETGRDASITYRGLIAQEVEQVMPEMVTSGPSKMGEFEFDDMRMLDTGPLTYALVNAVKELNDRTYELDARTRSPLGSAPASDVNQLTGALSRVLKLRGVRFQNLDTGQSDIRLDDLALEYPELATSDSRLTAPIVEALREINDRLTALERQ